MNRLLLALATALLTATTGLTPAAHAAGPTDSRLSSPLSYKGGPVMVKVKNYLVFWNGGNKKAFDEKYVALLQRWQKDARHTAVFRSTMQYTQADGQHPTDTTYAATYTNNTRFGGKGVCAKVCVTESDIAHIAASTAVAHKIKLGLGTMVYVYTPKGVHRCNYLTDNDTRCEDEQDGDYGRSCGFHGDFAVGTKTAILVYIKHPEPNCYLHDGTQRFPNNLAADAAVNMTSHFQMEAITDPLSDGWIEDIDDVDYDSVVENATECLGIFGPVLPGRKGNTYYKGHTYDVQAQASNKDEGCVVDSRPDGF